MPTKYTTRIPGIIQQIPGLGNELVMQVAEQIAHSARERAPVAPEVHHGDVEPGTLRDSIEARAGTFSAGRRSKFAAVAESAGVDAPTGAHASTFEAYGVWSAWWSNFVEFGTSHSPPEPFLIPAVEDQRRQIQPLGRRIFGRLGL